jgi:hypothetical protein
MAENDMRIDVYDNFLTPDECIRIVNDSRETETGKWRWNPFEVDIYKNERFLSGMIANLPKDTREQLDTKVLKTASELTGRNDFEISRAYMNGWKPNEISLPHKDQCHTTCLIYMNFDYDVKYGGETIFFENERDALYAVSPRVGRAVFFDGWLLHKAGSFNHSYRSDYRYTIAYKLTVPEDQEKALKGDYYEK